VNFALIGQNPIESQFLVWYGFELVPNWHLANLKMKTIIKFSELYFDWSKINLLSIFQSQFLIWYIKKLTHQPMRNGRS